MRRKKDEQEKELLGQNLDAVQRAALRRFLGCAGLSAPIWFIGTKEGAAGAITPSRKRTCS